MSRLRDSGGWRAVLVIASLTLLATAPGFAQVEVHELAIRKVYDEWVQTTHAKDLDRWASFLAPDPIFLPPNSPALRGDTAVKDFYAALFADERFSLDCRQESVEVAESEDFAWSTGHCEATFTDRDGGPGRDTSKWIKVWKRLPNGQWKCTANSWSSTLSG